MSAHDSEPLATATGATLDRILDDTYPLWGEGLSRDAYGRWNRAQQASPWGRAHLRRVALLEGRDVLASAKRYDLTMRIGGSTMPVLGIGAVFTRPDLRGRGHARTLIARILDDAAVRGVGAALLFSEIGAPYYEQLGFTTVPMPVLTLEVVRGKGAPATHVRAGDDRDYALLAEIDAAQVAAARVALDRSPESIAFGITRKRLFAGLGAAGLNQLEFVVAEEGGRAVAYVVLTRGPHGVMLEACGDRDPAGARVGAILQVLAAREPAEADTPIRAWLPAAFRPPQIRVVAEAPAAEIMMMRAIGGGPTLGDWLAAGPRSADVAYWHVDVF